MKNFTINTLNSSGFKNIDGIITSEVVSTLDKSGYARTAGNVIESGLDRSI